MKSKFDEYFSCEKLCNNWKDGLHKDKALIEINNSVIINDKYFKLKNLLNKKYDDISSLNANIFEIEEAINKFYSPDNKYLFVDKKEKEYIVFLLEQLEELVWAMELSIRKK